MAEYIERNKMLSKVKTNYIEDAKNGYDYYDYFLQDDLMSEPTADVVERSKIDKAVEEIKNITPRATIRHGKTNTDSTLMIPLDKVIEILKRNIGE